jgi:hypothetical protein
LTKSFNQHSTEITPLTQKSVNFGIQINEVTESGSPTLEARKIDFLEMKLNAKDFVIRRNNDPYIKFEIMIDSSYKEVKVTTTSLGYFDTLAIVLSQMGGLWSALAGIAISAVYYYQRNHVI